ncbi:MAG: squalene synthase HpnC [Burkholderiales bacterium]|nr:squalene synthase HpnC [Burkholderiales bacterium]
MPVEHYENFPVASVLLPGHLRPAVEAIYAFARTADDIADEGDATPEQRIEDLKHFNNALDEIESGKKTDSLLVQKLANTIAQYHLPIQPFRDLLSAFTQDIETTRYQTFDALLDYCKRSANPVGKLMLHLYGMASDDNLRQSDAICTALQLINFWQDVGIDWQKKRIYVPLADLQQFGITENQIAEGVANEKWIELMHFQTQRARELMLTGAPLATQLPGRIGWELRLVIQGGLRILEKINTAHGDVFKKRPKLRQLDWLIIIWRSIWM